jgi:hypothetical protein
MRAFIRTLGIGAATAALIATAPTAQAGRGGDDHGHGHGHGGHGSSDTSIDDIFRIGFISRGGDTASIKVTYTCPEDAEAVLRVSLEQQQDDHHGHGHGHHRGRGHDDTTTGSELVRHLDCSGDSEWEIVDIDADGRSEWERGDAEAEAEIFSWTDDHHGHSSSDRDSERKHVELVSQRH